MTSAMEWISHSDNRLLSQIIFVFSIPREEIMNIHLIVPDHFQWHLAISGCTPFIVSNLLTNTVHFNYPKQLETLEKQAIIHILIIKPTRCTNYSNLFWNKTTCFRQFLYPSSDLLHCTHSSGICHTGFADILLSAKSVMTYTIAVRTV